MQNERKVGRARPSKSVAAPSSGEVAAGVVSDVRRDGAVAKSVVTKRAGRANVLAVFDALTNAGLEIGARHVREPLEGQLAAAVRGGPLSLRGLDAHVRGATLAEAKSAALALVARGRLRLVARGKELAVTSVDSLVLDARTRERLAHAVDALVRASKLAAKHRASLLAADVEAAFAPFLQPSSARAELRTIRDVAALVEAQKEPSGLTWVPKLVRLLGGEAAREAVHAELLRGARAGRFELRPESGMGRLSAEDAELCVPGPQGSRLSWVRRIEEAS